jgi:TolA-binding protein
MKLKNPCLGLFLSCFLLLAAVVSTAQNAGQADYLRRFENGAQLYELSRWYEAAIEFRRAQEIAGNINDRSRALYWVILSELAYSDYGSALRDMDELQRIAPGSSFNRDMIYHRARVYYNQGFFDESLMLFMNFTEAVTDDTRTNSDRRAAAFFWIGECLYSMGQFDEAENFYSYVMARYPDSPKFEAASYRIDLIKQKKIEAELLALLQWSHEEALRTSEDYQRRIRTYEYTLNAYQRRIAELTQGQEPVQVIPGVQEVFPPPVNTAPPQSSLIPPAIQQPSAAPSGNIQSQNNTARPPADENLLERARQLGNELQQLLKEIDLSRGAM